MVKRPATLGRMSPLLIDFGVPNCSVEVSPRQRTRARNVQPNTKRSQTREYWALMSVS